MPPIEQLLRAELKRVTDQVKPEQLRPLRVPARRHGWRVRLLPVAAGAAVVAIIAVAALLAGMTAGPRPAVPAPVTGAMPRYYITVTRSAAGLAAVVHTSADGRVTGTVKVPSLTDAAAWSVTAAGDDRSFVIAADLSQTAIAGTAEFRFFRLLVSPAGRPGTPTELPAVPANAPLLTGMALSPDGTLLALSLEYGGPMADFRPYGGVEVINLETGGTRTWLAPGDATYWPGVPAWAGGDRMIMFTWWHSPSRPAGAAVIVGVRELDAAPPGANLLASRSIPFRAVTPGIGSAMIASRGREIVAAACHDTAPPGHQPGSVTAKIIELSAADGRLLRVLRTQTARYTSLGGQDRLDGGCAVLSVDPTGNHVLVQGFAFGRIDQGVFTALPGAMPGVTFVAAAWLFAGGAVDLLTEEVGVAEMPGVLLDHVQVDQAQRHELVVVGEGVVEGRVDHGRVGQFEFLGQAGVVGGGAGRVDLLEIGRPVGEGRVDELAREPLAEPGALDLRHMPDQPQQGQPRRRHGVPGELLAGQASALVEQRRPVPVKEGLQHGSFGSGQRPLRPLHVRGFPRHGAHLAMPLASRRPSAPSRWTMPMHYIARVTRCGEAPVLWHAASCGAR